MRGEAVAVASDRRLNIGPVEIGSLEQQRLVAKLGDRIGGAIDDIQLCRMPLAFSEPAKSLESRICHRRIERNNRDARLVEHLVECATASAPNRACKTIRVSSTVIAETERDGARSMASWKRAPSASREIAATIAELSTIIRTAGRRAHNRRSRRSSGKSLTCMGETRAKKRRNAASRSTGPVVATRASRSSTARSIAVAVSSPVMRARRCASSSNFVDTDRRPNQANCDAQNTIAGGCRHVSRLGTACKWRSGERTRTETDLAHWRGARASAGRIAPRGFPKENKFG